MPVVFNSGAEIGFGNLACLKGEASTMVDAVAWDKLKDTQQVRGFLATGRLILEGQLPADAVVVDDPGADKTVPGQDGAIPPALDEDGDGFVDLSKLNAKDAAKYVSQMEDPELIVALVEGETRTTVTDAAGKRILELTAPTQD